MQFFNGRLDLKMYFYVVGGTMLSLNAWSGAVWHHENIADLNPGVFAFAAFVTLYVFDYFIFERTMLYTYDIIHERLGFKLFWGGLIVYGWVFIIPMWGLAAHPDPGLSGGWRVLWLIGVPALYAAGWVITRGASLQKYTFKRWPERTFLGVFAPQVIEAGDRKILCSGFWGAARHFNYMGEWCFGLAIALVWGHFGNLWAWVYFVYVIGLFLLRQMQDDRHCANKYGPDKVGRVPAASPLPDRPRHLLIRLARPMRASVRVGYGRGDVGSWWGGVGGALDRRGGPHRLHGSGVSRGHNGIGGDPGGVRRRAGISHCWPRSGRWGRWTRWCCRGARRSGCPRLMG